MVDFDGTFLFLPPPSLSPSLALPCPASSAFPSFCSPSIQSFKASKSHPAPVILGPLPVILSPVKIVKLQDLKASSFKASSFGTSAFNASRFTTSNFKT
jgi:hypothetical protein